MKFALYSRGDSFSNDICQQIKRFLNDQKGWSEDDSDPELIIFVGGDGTLLRAIQNYVDKLDHLKFVGVHTGTLGFFTDYTKDELDTFLHDLVTNTPTYKECPLLEMAANGNYQDVHYAFNEFRLGSFLNTVNFDVFIDDEFFEHVTGSGICISTQAGSTGINRGLMGAVVDDGLDLIQLAEVIPVINKDHHSLRNPYIMRSDRTIQVTGESLRSCEIIADYLNLNLKDVDILFIRQSDRKVVFSRYRPYSYLKRLKSLY